MAMGRINLFQTVRQHAHDLSRSFYMTPELTKRATPQMHRRLFGSTTHQALSQTARGWLEEWEGVFTEKDIPEPSLSARYLLLHVLQPEAKSLQVLERPGALDTQLTDRQLADLSRLSFLRLQRVSVQHCIGEWDFHDVTLALRKPILVPRPETEELVEHVRQQLAGQPIKNGLLLDVGCGSGCISLALLKALPWLRATAIDVNCEAVDLTRENASRLGLADRIDVVLASASDYQPPGDVKFDILREGRYHHRHILLGFGFGMSSKVSNPPYIPTPQMPTLAPEVGVHEDTRALDGGMDGLDVVRVILNRVGRGDWLRPGSSVWLEVDCTHPPVLERMVSHDLVFPNMEWVGSWADFAGLPRFCHARYVP